MSKSIHQADDKFFKRAMQDICVATEFFEMHVPKEIQQHLDLNSLKLTPESFIDTAYQAYASDLVYEVNMKTGGSGYLYLLVEKQNRVDNLMAFRLLRYSVLLMDRYLKQNAQASLLPFVWPMVLYAGHKPWDAPTSVLELFGKYNPFAQKYWLTYRVVDLQQTPDETLESGTKIRASIMQLALKHRKTQDFHQFVSQLFENPSSELLYSSSFNFVTHSGVKRLEKSSSYHK